MKTETYNKVIGKLIFKMKKTQTLPWQKKWKPIASTNLSSMNPYHGYNKLVTQFFIVNEEWKYPFFMTYKQAQKVGCYVNKGSEGIPIVYFNVMEKKRIIEDAVTKEEKEVKDKIPFLRYSTIFNVGQMQISEPVQKVLDKSIEIFSNQEKKDVQQIIDNYIEKENIQIKQNTIKPVYKENVIFIPNINQYKSADSYYKDLFKCLIASTADEKRVKRNIQDTSSFSFEDLVQEIGACFLAAETNIDVDINNTVSYVQQWISILEKNPKWIVQAANKAEKAVNCILGDVKNENKTNK